jgi:CTP:phosphocholine cytidylyltransferase-like protein
MAAGSGTRMNPVTLEVPKPLVVVNGKRMIDTIIDGLHSNGIYEIYIVVGYKSHKFEVIKEKYQGITIIENPYYNDYNNISSLYVAKDYISDVIIIDGDQIIYNKEILDPRFKDSCYCALFKEKTSEWLLSVKDGKILSCNRDGGENGYQLYSVSLWSKSDGEKLQKHLEAEFKEKKNKDLYWDDVALFCHPDEYDLHIREISDGDLVEIDNFDELVAIDSSYLYLK